MKPAEFSVNPYNFQVPVSKPEAFAGRKSQRDEIAYYLDQALKTRPTNIAIVGPRAAGKTSLLNMIARDAADRGIVTVRINFDESHARSQLRFFFKVFDALVSEVVKQRRASDGARCFGGRGGRFFGLYTQCISTFEQASLDELELMFPNIYASAMRAGNEDRIVVSQSFFEDDLRRVADEAGRPIALIMDECNVFVQNREILQAMRGMFQNLERYMLVMTGTNEMFPVIDEVYSPVGRGFKRLEVAGFDALEETFQCMERPCKASGVPTFVLDAFRPKDSAAEPERHPPALKELHAFTAGNPHEIQLACHFMFVALQKLIGIIGDDWDDSYPQEIVGFQLSDEVIEKVLGELATDEERRALLGRLKSSSPEALAALALLTGVGFGLPKEIYLALYQADAALEGPLASTLVVEQRGHELVRRRQRPPVSGIKDGLDECVARGWVSVAPGSEELRWSGDQLHEIMFKYIARAKRIKIARFGQQPAIGKYLQQLSECIGPQAQGSAVSVSWSGDLEPEQLRIPEAALALFGEQVEVLDLRVRLPKGVWQCVQRVSGVPNTERVGGEVDWPKRFQQVHELSAPFGVDWMLSYERKAAGRKWGQDPRDWSSLLEHEQMLTHKVLIAVWFAKLCDYYLEGGVVRPVLEQAVNVQRSLRSDLLPNLGYMALAIGLPSARSLLDAADKAEGSSLVRYNRALSLLLLSEPQVHEAMRELTAISMTGESDFRIVLRVRVDAGAIEMYEHQPGSGEVHLTIGDLVAEALRELEKVADRAGELRVIAARPNG